MTVLANVVNNGACTGSYNVALRINGKVEQQRTVEVSPGSAYPVKFTVTKAEPGTYTVIIGSQRASFLITEDTAVKGADGGSIAIIIMAILFTIVLIVLLFSFRRRPTY